MPRTVSTQSQRAGSVQSQQSNGSCGRRHSREPSQPGGSDIDGEDGPPPAKRALIVLSAKKRPTDEYGIAARLITRIHKMTWVPLEVINAGVVLISSLGDEDDHDAFDDEFENATGSKRVLYDIFAILLERIPGIIDATDWTDIKVRLDEGKRAARTEDNFTLKCAVVKFRNWNPPLNSRTKRNRGLNHLECAMLLAPISVKWDNEEQRNDFLIRLKPPMTAKQRWPAFIYENYVGNVENLAQGLLQSDIMVKAARALLFPPSVANRDDEADHRSNRKSKATIYNMTSVTSGFLAYVAVALRYALSSETSFMSTSGLFNYEQFYNDIVNHLNDPACQPDNDALFKWWNSQLFPETEVDSEEEPESMVAELRRQAQARHHDA
ncbi:hypothetical protein FRC07_010170 [Ceratobasidium sp. 392]|nr:hypothetical protein FRC07_010170 [Ceratobasidium sp. 392]